ncbi:MAG: HIRAN domain-containing protein [Eubacteriales bacterium]|jgi:hypothetical protein
MDENTELTIKQKDLVTLVSKNGIGDVLKPLQKEIYLFDTYVAGTSHLEDKEVLKTLQINDQLILRREDNKFDKKAILVLTQDQKKIGYVPEKDNVVFSRLMDAGKLLTAKILNISEKGTYTHISIGIYLIDF